ncbi:MAG: hypothetical protein Q9219_006188 [cf. Caloplaca sp. 3 TL-2023]
MAKLNFFLTTLLLCYHTNFAIPLTTFHHDEELSNSSPHQNTTTTSPTPLGTTPWPPWSSIRLTDGYYIILLATSYKKSLAPSKLAIQGLISDFSDDIAAAYPPPGLSPPKATLAYYDMDSCTKMEIGEEARRLLLSRPAPTAVLLMALGKLAQEVGGHGVAGKVLVNIIRGREQFNKIYLVINELGLKGCGEGAGGREGGELRVWTE